MMTAAYLWPIVLVAAFAYDFSVTRYVVAVEERAGVRAGMWSVAIFLVGLVGTLGIIKVSAWLILPEAVGLFLGTMVGVSFKPETEDDEDNEDAYEVYYVAGKCVRGQHLDPCLDPSCWSNGPEGARARLAERRKNLELVP